MKVKKRAVLLQKLDLPLDMANGVSEIVVCGGSELRVSACLKILKYEENEILLLMSDGILKVFGSNFTLNSFGDSSIKIKGTINSVEFT